MHSGLRLPAAHMEHVIIGYVTLSLMDNRLILNNVNLYFLYQVVILAHS